ncbi:DUF6953 family protein [Acinetobacter brisouii]
MQNLFEGNFIHETENRNLSIAKDVLKEFRKLIEGKVV